MTDQCPNNVSGPTCGLLPYNDLDADIALDFVPPPPINRTDLGDLRAIIDMFVQLNTTLLKVQQVRDNNKKSIIKVSAELMQFMCTVGSVVVSRVDYKIHCTKIFANAIC